MTNRATALLSGLPILSLAAVALTAFAAPAPEERKPREIEWGKEANGIAVSIAPAEKGEGRFVIRWKNVGKDTLELPWVRFGSDQVYKGYDDLLNHVTLVGPGDKVAPARKYQFPGIGGPPYRPRTVILKPGDVHEETIDLWTYVEKPDKEGSYRLSITQEIKNGYAPSKEGAKYWTGKVQSNVLEFQVGK